jgi:hypothetical protein
MQFGNYPLPMTPSDFGSDHDSPYCSPRPPNHAEPVFAQTSASGPGERTHTTSGVSFASLALYMFLETNDSSEETSPKSRRSTCLPRA